MRPASVLLAAAATASAQVHIPSFSIPAGGFPPLPTLFKRQDFSEPCEEASASWSAMKAQATSSDETIAIPAKVAYECLQSVPVDEEGNVKEIEELKLLIEFQSTLNLIKDGIHNGNGTETLVEPVDVVGSLDEISQGIQNGSYASEWDVQSAIANVFNAVKDFHFTWTPDIFEPFVFIRDGGSIVSLSKDGSSLPEPYLLSDVFGSRRGNFTPSSIKTINGKDAVEYLVNTSSKPLYHDPDARYNALLANLPRISTGEENQGSFYQGLGVYDGPSTNFAFTNGSVKALPNIALIRGQFDFSNVVDGKSFFAQFCSGPPQSTQEEPEATPTPSSTFSNETTTPTPTPSIIPTPTGYPYPVTWHESLVLQGYYLNDTGYDDTAVLAIPSFEAKGTATEEIADTSIAGIIEIQTVLRAFLADAVKQGKKKLIVDLRGNGGGTIDLGFEVFKQLFPDEEPYGATRYRAHQAFEIYSSEIADLAENATMMALLPQNILDQTVYDVFNYQNILNVNGTPFDSFRDYWGPYTFNNDTFTALRRYNFSNSRGGHTTGANLTGYNGVPAAPQPFESDNIIILQDGLCGSTCAIFSELMREQGKVQQISIGGAPHNGPMQGVAGSKGANVFPMDILVSASELAVKSAKYDGGPEVEAMVNKTAAGKIAMVEQVYLRSAHYIPDRTLAGGINSLDNFRQNDTTETPLEFIYEATDCRFFYTKETLLSPVAVWKQTFDAKWGNGKCVQGSTGDESALSTVEGKTFGAGGKNSSAPGEWQGAANGLQSSAILIGAAIMGVLALVM